MLLFRSFNQLQCRSPVALAVGLKNRYCFEINQTIEVQSQVIDFPYFYTFPHSKSCDGEFHIGLVPLECVSDPDPMTNSLSHMFLLAEGK